MPSGPYDWLTFSCIWIGAIYLAFDAGSRQINKGKPLATKIGTDWLGYLPLASVLLASGLIGWRALYPASTEKPEPSPTENHASVTLQLVNSQSIRRPLRQDNLFENPIVYQLGDGKWIFMLVFDKRFDAFQGDVSINGETQTRGWQLGLKTDRYAVFVLEGSKVKDGNTIELKVYGKDFKG